MNVYGLDMAAVHFETDYAGNRLTATVPYPMFSALVEFWKEARRAQTAAIEARGGALRTSLGTLPESREANTGTAGKPPTAPAGGQRNPHERHWQRLLSAMPEDRALMPEPVATSPVSTLPDNSLASRPISSTPGSFFPRIFIDAPPPEVQVQIERGVYFLRAWRIFAELTVSEVALLYEATYGAITFLESGRNAPRRQTLDRLAPIFGCSVDQLTPQPGSNTSSWCAPAGHDDVGTIVHAPEDTCYPDAVRASLLEGKTPMTAWRLYRGLSLKDVADGYGTSPAIIREMEQQHLLKRKAIDKLRAIFRCSAAQLMAPAGLFCDPGDDHARAAA